MPPADRCGDPDPVHSKGWRGVDSACPTHAAWQTAFTMDVIALARDLERNLRTRVQKRLIAWMIPFVRRSGFRVEELERGHTICTMPLGPNRNHIGTMYAGALFTLAELPGGALFFASFDEKEFFPIVKEMSIRFLKPADTAVRIEMRMSDAEIESLAAEARKTGKAEFVLEGQLENAAGVVVATSRGVYQIRRRR